MTAKFKVKLVSANYTIKMTAKLLRTNPIVFTCDGMPVSLSFSRINGSSYFSLNSGEQMMFGRVQELIISKAEEDEVARQIRQLI